MDTFCGSQRSPFRDWFYLSTCLPCWHRASLVSVAVPCPAGWTPGDSPVSTSWLPTVLVLLLSDSTSSLFAGSRARTQLVGSEQQMFIPAAPTHRLDRTFGLSNSEAQAASWFIKWLTSQTPWRPHASVLKCWDYRYELLHTIWLFNNENITM